jgi:TonB-dependent SusC/RagA subfamily outer membrane receptor
MDILKDASSTAIYGSRGANGVILITTKNGYEGAPVVELNSYLSFKDGQNPYTMMDPVLYAETVNLGTPGAYSQDQINALKGTPGTDAYGEMLQQGLLQNYEVSVRGGSKMTKYSLSGGVQDEDGVVVNTHLRKYMFRSNISTKITDKLSVGLNLFTAQNKSHNIASAYEEVQLAPTWGPAENVKHPDGTWQVATSQIQLCS